MGTGLTTLSVDVMVTRAVLVTDIDNNLTINAPTNFDANARVRYRIKQGTGGKTLTFVGFASTGGYTDAGNVAYSSIMFDAVWTQSGWKIDLIGGGWG